MSMTTLQIKVSDAEFMCQFEQEEYDKLIRGLFPHDFIKAHRTCRIMFVQVPPQPNNPQPGIAMTSKPLASSGYKDVMNVAVKDIKAIMEVDESHQMYKNYIKQTTNIAIPTLNLKGQQLKKR